MGWIATLLLALAAYLTATISGVVGTAGGALLLVILTKAMGDPAAAIPVHACVQVVSNVTRIWVFLPHVRWRPVGILMLTALPGPVIGLEVARRLDGDGVKVVMAVGILYATWAPRWGLQSLPETAAFGIAGVLGGFLGVLVGAIGVLVAPFFLRRDFTREQMIGTVAVCQAYLHLLKIAAFGTMGFSFAEYGPLIVPMALATMGGAYTGKWLLGKMTERHFMVLFKVVLSVMALDLVREALA